MNIRDMNGEAFERLAECGAGGVTMDEMAQALATMSPGVSVGDFKVGLDAFIAELIRPPLVLAHPGKRPWWKRLRWWRKPPLTAADLGIEPLPPGVFRSMDDTLRALDGGSGS